LFTLGEIYSSDFYNASRFLTSAILANLMLFISVSYLWKFGETLHYKPEPIKAVTMLFLVSLLISFFMATLFYRRPYPESYPGEANKLKYGNAMVGHPALRMVTKLQGANDFDLSEDTT